MDDDVLNKDIEKELNMVKGIREGKVWVNWYNIMGYKKKFGGLKM